MGSKGGVDHVTDTVVVVTEVTCTDSGGSGTGSAVSVCVYMCLSVWECELIFTELQVNNIRPIFTAAAEI